MTLLVIGTSSLQAELSEGSSSVSLGDGWVGGGILGEADDHFIDCAVGGGGDGSLSTPWNSLDDIGARATGDDVYLKAGCLFSEQTLTVNWPGVPSDRAVVGCYFVDTDGYAKTCTTNQSKPEIRGNYPDTCSDNTLCDIGGPDDTPTNISGALVNINANYVTFRDIALHDSAGRGLQANSGATITGMIVERLDVDHSAQHSLYFSRITDSVIRNNTVTRNSMCDGYSEAACAETGGNVDGGNVRPWAGAITLNNALTADVLIEGNTVNRTYGEGITLFGGSRAVVRNNSIGHTVRPSIYVNHWVDFVIENNVVYGDPGGLVDPSSITGMSYAQDGIGFRQETNNGGAGDQNNTGIARNNMLTGVPCISMDDTTAASVSSDIDLYGNSCLGPQSDRAFVVFDTVTATDVNVDNNLLYAPTLTAANQCVVNIANVALNYGLWGLTPSDADCVGANDVIGDPLTTTGYAALITRDYTNPPVAADFGLQAGSPAKNAANDLSASTCITAANHAYAFSEADTTLSITEWARCLYADANEGLRPAAPAIGAIEPNPAPATILFAATGDSDLSTSNTASVSHPVGNQPDQLLLCGVTYEDNGDPNGSQAISTVTYNGVPMTAAGDAEVLGTNSVRYYYMLDAQLPPNAGSYTALATAINDEGGQGGLAVSCMTFQNTHQIAPTIYSATGTDTVNVSNTVAVDNEDYLMVVASSSQGNRTHTWGTGTWTEMMDLSKTLNNDTAQGSAYIQGADFNQ